MKKLTLFYLEICPYCTLCRRYMRELQNENPAYAALSIELVEESVETARADSRDYYYVPCFYLEDEKLAEGSIDKAGVRAVFDMALQA